MAGISGFFPSIFRTIGDQLGEAKASGNLGNTLKVLGNYEEAIVCCQRHLDISRELNDKVRTICMDVIILNFKNYIFHV